MQKFKVVEKDESGNILKLVEEGKTEGKFYQISSKAQKYAVKLKVGDLIEADTVKSKNASYINFFKVIPAVSNTSTSANSNKYQQNWSEEADRKNRQGLSANVATIVASLGFTKDNSPEEIGAYFNKLYEILSLKFNSSTQKDKAIEEIVSPPKEEEIVSIEDNDSQEDTLITIIE